MKYYKIAKYNYSKDGCLLEWSSIEEAIKRGAIKEYLLAEKEYLQVACNFFYANNKLYLNSYEDYSINLERIEKLKIIEKDNIFLFKQIDTKHLPCEIPNVLDYMFLIRNSLRTLNWSLFVNKKNYICTGDDYYLLIGIDNNINIENIVKGTKLFYYEWVDVFS